MAIAKPVRPIIPGLDPRVPIGPAGASCLEASDPAASWLVIIMIGAVVLTLASGHVAPALIPLV